MNKIQKKSRILLLFLCIILALSTFTACSSKKEFSYSGDLDENGFWKKIKATKFVDMIEYKGISIPSDVHTVSDESVQSEIESILTDFTINNEIKDRAVVDGDTVSIDYVGTVDGVPFDGGNTNGEGAEVTIGVTNYIDDFLQQIIGHTPGESFDVEVTFPTDYGADNLNGKDAVFAVTLNHIVESIIPELNDKFVADNLTALYGWKTVSEMETAIKDDLQSLAVIGHIQDYLIDNFNVKSLPDSMIKYQENSMIQYFKDNAAKYNMELDQFLTTYVGVANSEELLKMYAEDNTYTAKMYLIVQAIAEDAKISVTDSDITEYFKKNSGNEDYTELKDLYGMPFIKMNVLNELVMKYLQSNAVLE